VGGTFAVINSPNQRLFVSQGATINWFIPWSLSDAYRALLVGERIANAEEILAEVSNALVTAARAGNVETA
jgi:hypothetical protein